MSNTQGWLPILRDALILYLFFQAISFLLGEFLGSAEPPPLETQIHAVLFYLLVGSLAFAAVGYFAKGSLWKHQLQIVLLLYVVAVIQFAFQIYRLIPGQDLNGMMLFNIFWGPFIDYASIALAGTAIACILRKVIKPKPGPGE